METQTSANTKGIETLADGQRRLFFWIIGTCGGVATSLLLLLANLALGALGR